MSRRAVIYVATEDYLYCAKVAVERIAVAASVWGAPGVFLFATDRSKKCRDFFEKIKMPAGWEKRLVQVDFEPCEAPELWRRVSRIHAAGFSAAIEEQSERCVMVEADNLVPPNAFLALDWALKMPDESGLGSYYDIAAATYPNDLFLCGFGTPQNPIAEDFEMRERRVPERLRRVVEACERRLRGQVKPFLADGKICWSEAANDVLEISPQKARELAAREHKRMGRLREKIKKYAPEGNVWEVTAKHGWRRRGWFEQAYPAVGKGAVVPVDWCGLGCTMLSRRALLLTDMTDYDGGGTFDLFLCWRRWHPAGLKIACVPHVVTDHVKRGVEGRPARHIVAYHEPEGECRGHLRQRSQEWKNL